MQLARTIAAFCSCVAPLDGAQADFATAAAHGPKQPIVAAAAIPSSFALGVDDCASAHTNAGAGDVPGVAYSTGTTGTTGQSEALCLFFGQTGIANDVWFDWTATQTGVALLSSCGDATDTKVAIYPASSCPSSGTALACNDDSCALQTEVAWDATSGTTYTIQLGTFPGASGGSGSFAVEQLDPLPCFRKDDETSENALGLTAGGEIGWLSRWDQGPTGCQVYYDSVEVAYGSFLFPGTVTNGAASRIAIYKDADTDSDPRTGLTLELELNTVVMNGNTDQLNWVPFPGCLHSSVDEHVWLLVTADHAAGQFPAPMDQTPPTHAADMWTVGSTLGPGTLDTDDLNANDVAPVNVASVGLPANWLSHIDDLCDVFVGTPVCFGDGSGTACPCGNTGDPGGGCANGTGAGAFLWSNGTPSVTADTMSLMANGVINNNGLFFQGNNTIGGGDGIAFGDGIRCCGGGVVRIQVVNPPGTASPATAQMTETATTNGPNGTITAGTKKCYQFWYRDPATSPCGAQFNLTNAVTITWSP